jgi:hypothetical protein
MPKTALVPTVQPFTAILTPVKCDIIFITANTKSPETEDSKSVFKNLPVLALKTNNKIKYTANKIINETFKKIN